MARLYVTYRYADLELAREFVSSLRARNHHVTLDQDYLVLGEEWRRALHDAFVAADGVIALLTEHSVDPGSRKISSEYIAADIGAARAAGKAVLPILVKDTPIPHLVSDIYAERLHDTGRADVQRMVAAIERSLERRAEQKKDVTGTLLLPGYEHLANALRHFHEDTPYEKSVFVMMKYPVKELSEVHQQLLNDIWRVVSDTLAQRGLKARRADQRTYHDQLWENVCVYMFGSKYGLAVLEDRAADELNPNVTLEYGFMKALNRMVGLLRVEDFAHDRADLIGKLSRSFAIDANDRLNELSLKSAIQDWLAGMPL